MCNPILVTLLKMQPHYSQSSRENVTPSSGTSLLAWNQSDPAEGKEASLVLNSESDCAVFAS